MDSDIVFSSSFMEICLHFFLILEAIQAISASQNFAHKYLQTTSSHKQLGLQFNVLCFLLIVFWIWYCKCNETVTNQC